MWSTCAGHFKGIAASSRLPSVEKPYTASMNLSTLPGGVVHEIPSDLALALNSSASAATAWEDITPLARNEFICWVEDAKRPATRERRIGRTVEELNEGMRRPCCWPGCSHRG